jgi:hypothetical protein
LILRHVGLERRQFDHLMPYRLTRLSGEWVSAASTARGLALHHCVHLLQRYQRPAMHRMAGLSPGFTPRGLSGGPAFDVWAIRGGRLVGILGILAEPFSQNAELLL